jgi:acyl carrier protein
MNPIANKLTLVEIEQKVCDIASKQLGVPRPNVSPASTLIEDLHCDSLDLIELIMEVEEELDVALPEDAPNSVYKAVFTRSPFRLADFAELVYLQQGTGTPERRGWRQQITRPPRGPTTPFSQLSGSWRPLAPRRSPDHWSHRLGLRSLFSGEAKGAVAPDDRPIESVGHRLLEPISTDGIAQYRRVSDGMRCVLIPSAEVEIGSDAADSCADERPVHHVGLDAFLIDAEPVSTTAYCRFLNSIDAAGPEHLADWFLLAPNDDRSEHLLIHPTENGWSPISGAEQWPMILVSWHGANAYALWANGCDWLDYRAEQDADASCFLPSEAQWEYAARGATRSEYPWGDGRESNGVMLCGQHHPKAVYDAENLPLAAVHAQLGMSPFGLHHMAGNVWQWCRDWYDSGFYSTPAASSANAWNRTPTAVRSERGGSWVGPAALCRSSHRRGRNPFARGRCLGFRCLTSLSSV